jgi:hypothetical protein
MTSDLNTRRVNILFGTTVLAVEAVILLIIKLILVSHREMVLEPYDASSYVDTSFNHLSILDIHLMPPGTSYVIWCARTLGIPYRLFQEVLLALATFLFLRPLAAWKLGLTVATLVFGLILFNPNLIISMDYVRSEPVYLFISLSGLGGVLGIILAPRDRLPIGSFVLTLAAFGFTALTRDEGPIVWAEMAAAAVFSLVFLRGSERWRFKRAIFACGCAAAANLIASQAMSAAAYANYGFWGSSPIQSREWWGLYRVLLALPVHRTNRRAFVTEENLDLAAELSPTLARFRPCLEEARREAEEYGPELLNAHIHWRLLQCANGEFDKLVPITAEIIEGAKIRNIQLKWPIFGIVPRPISQWMPFFGPSVLNVLALAISNPPTLITNMHQWPYDLSQQVESLFDAGLLRRVSLAKNPTNPELPAFKYVFSVIYSAVSVTGLIATGLTLLCALSLLLTNRPRFGDQRVIFVIALISFDIAARVGFYSIVEWVGWDVEPRYILCSQVLLAFPSIGVAAMFSIWIWNLSASKVIQIADDMVLRMKCISIC